ncbi:hypothetical protein [Roseateles sp.]|uniref:hypothetical protein n=1 Tax=Roseateles sp. TaxID=1971397 RepID=UPI003BA88248
MAEEIDEGSRGALRRSRAHFASNAASTGVSGTAGLPGLSPPLSQRLRKIGLSLRQDRR